MSAVETEWAVRLNAAPFLDAAKAWTLWRRLGGEGLRRGGDGDWTEASGAKPETAARWRRAARAFDYDGELRKLAALGARLLVRGEPGYPELLEAAPDAPLALYVAGRLSDATAVAVVGSRGPTAFGRRMARRFGRELAERGVVVASGLARGIDAESHLGALERGGETWAVLGSGLGGVYPPENRDLARRIAAEGGAVLSEYSLSTPPDRALFPRRNRIIAGLSWATVVVEGRANSGARSTAVAATAYGREVLAVPGPADSPLSVTPHRLLRDGAHLAIEIDDILRVLPPGAAAEPARRRAAAAAPADLEEKNILGLLGSESLSLDELGRATGLDTPRLSTIMFGLELKDLVCAVPGQRYAKKNL